MKTADNIPVIEWINLKKLSDKRPAILITSKSADTKSKHFLSGINFVNKIIISTTKENEVENIVRNKVSRGVIYAVGGGKVIDVARLLAKEWGLEIICVPTIISSDAFLVNSTGLRKKGCVIYIPTKKADKILLDINLLKRSPSRYHLSGCGDVLSIFTGIYDWKYANNKGYAKPTEVFSPSVAKVASGILEGLICSADEIKKGTATGLKSIITSLAMEVQLCNLYGNSRPEEGGEHFFAYCIENKVPDFLHGEMVSFGVLLTSYIQGQNWLKMKSFMDYIGLNYKPAVITRQVTIETLIELPEYVKIHNLPYSIYNDFNYLRNEKRLESFFKSINID